MWMIARLKMNDILWYKTVLYNGGVKSFDSFIIRIYLKRRYPLHLPLNVTSDSLDHFFSWSYVNCISNKSTSGDKWTWNLSFYTFGQFNLIIDILWYDLI